MVFNRVELKARGKMAFQRNYGSAVAVALLMGIISMIFSGNSSVQSYTNSYNGYTYDSFSYNYSYSNNDLFSFFRRNPGIGVFAGLLSGIVFVMVICGILLKIFVENVLLVGGYRFFILNQTGRPGIGVLLDGFKSGHYGNLVLVMFLRELFIGLWSLLLIIPGIVKSYEYLMVPYILAENPGMDQKEAFLISKRMMDGQKWDTFVMDWSFVGWELLSIFTCGLLHIFFVKPYKEATYAELYAFNKMRAYQEGYIH